jgi:iron-sulfur cluster assembly protein
MGQNSNSGLASMPADWVLPSDAPEGEGGGSGTSGPVVILTEAAQVEVRRLIAAEGHPGLRLGIKGGGCSGLSYLLEFTEEREGDTVIDFGDFKVFLDRKSTIYLRGITLDHQSGLSGRGFVFQNPQASNTCGCGESFSL